jgi:hypothetical protein
VRDLLAQFVLSPPPAKAESTPENGKTYPRLQKRLDLKGAVNEVYSRLLAELRWTFVALEQQAIAQGDLHEPGDIFFLTDAEVRSRFSNMSPREHVTFADESERVEDMAIECPVSP